MSGIFETGDLAGSDLHDTAKRMDAAIVGLVLPTGMSMSVAIDMEELRMALYPIELITARFVNAARQATGIIQQEIEK